MKNRLFIWLAAAGVALLVVALCIIAAQWWNGAAPPAPAAAAPEAPPASLEEFYSLRGRPVRLAAGPFPEGRDALLSSRGAPAGSGGSLLLAWDGGKLVAKSANWGGSMPGIALDIVIGRMLGYRTMDIDADNRIKYLRLEGDVVFDSAAPRAECIAGLEQVILEQAHHRVLIKEVEVEMPRPVLRGAWDYHPIPDLPWSQSGPDKSELPVIELFGGALDAQLAGRKAFSQGDAGQFAVSLSSFLQKDVAVSATGFPARVRWYYNYRGDGSLESAAKAHDLSLVLEHVCEQTGLQLGQEMFKSRRLTIAEVEGGLLP